MTQTRLDKMAAVLQDSDLEAVLLNPGPTLEYLTGLKFHLMERPVVLFYVVGQKALLVLPELEQAKLAGLSSEITAFPYGEDPAGWRDVFHRAVRSLGLDGLKVGVEPGQLRLLEFRFVQEHAARAQFPDASSELAKLRVCKDADELDAIHRAVRVAQQALENTLPLVGVGVSEKEIAAELTLQLLRSGSDSRLPFEPIVSGGPNSANPHAVPTDRVLQPGDMLVIDWGARVDGYISDITRTFAISEAAPEFEKVHALVQAANAAGRRAAVPGQPAAAVDAAARSVIEEAGYGKYFNHRTGHGIGMDVHEDPYIRADNLQILQPGMTFTVEPGVYLPDQNGVRIEDNMVVTPAGSESLTDLPRELQILDRK